VKGLPSGIAKGLIGLIAKPTTGMLDVATNIAEGVKNTFGKASKSLQYKRTRAPRAIYGSFNVIKSYNEYDA